MKKYKTFEYTVTGSCLGILLLFFVSIGVRFFTRQILVEKLGMDNAFTNLVFWDKTEMNMVTGENWSLRYPFHDTEIIEVAEKESFIDKYENIVNNVEGKIENYTSNLLLGQAVLSELYEVYNDTLEWEWKDVGKILYMNNGYTTGPIPQLPEEDIDELAESVMEFSTYLEQQEIPFYYINTGHKVNPNDKQLKECDEQKVFSNENQDALLHALSTGNINFLDLRECMSEDGLNWYESYYKSDGHWKTETGLWAAGRIARLLNEKEGFEFEESLFAESSYEMTTYEDLGGIHLFFRDIIRTFLLKFRIGI